MFGKIKNGCNTRRRTTKPAAFDPTDKNAVIGVGAQITLDESGNIAQAGIGLCNAGPTSIKAIDAEEFLAGKPVAPDNINEAARLAMEASDPVDDDRGPVDYKRAMVRELTRRALRRAVTRAQGGAA